MANLWLFVSPGSILGIHIFFFVTPSWNVIYADGALLNNVLYVSWNEILDLTQHEYNYLLFTKNVDEGGYSGAGGEGTRKHVLCYQVV